MENLFANIPRELVTELIDALHVAPNVRIERIVSQGHASPPGFSYDEDEHEWVLLLQGASRLRVGTEVIEMKPGDFVNIAAHTRHRVEWTTPDETTVWLAVFYK